MEVYAMNDRLAIGDLVIAYGEACVLKARVIKFTKKSVMLQVLDPAYDGTRTIARTAAKEKIYKL